MCSFISPWVVDGSHSNEHSEGSSARSKPWIVAGKRRADTRNRSNIALALSGRDVHASGGEAQRLLPCLPARRYAKVSSWGVTYTVLGHRVPVHTR